MSPDTSGDMTAPMPEAEAARARLDRALVHLAVTFRGMTARADETQCKCHWGSPEELALLKLPDTALDPDLLHRTWSAPDWTDHGAVLRRVLPQFARELTRGLGPYAYDIHNVGTSFNRGNWQQWPAPQNAAVREFLHAWWAHTLLAPDPAVPARDLLALLREASDTLAPWLAVWEATEGPAPDQHLADTIEAWETDLMYGYVPWTTWGTTWDEDNDLHDELCAWFAHHAPARLRARGAPDRLVHTARLLGLPGPDRESDPHWPGPPKPLDAARPTP